MIRNYIDFNNAKEKCRDCSIGLCYNKVVLGDGLPIFLLGILPCSDAVQKPDSTPFLLLYTHPSPSKNPLIKSPFSFSGILKMTDAVCVLLGSRLYLLKRSRVKSMDEILILHTLYADLFLRFFLSNTSIGAFVFKHFFIYFNMSMSF